jgi:hypothetical protein
MTETVCIPVSVGELIDKISILNIKRIMISDLDKMEIVKNELIEMMDTAKWFLQNKEVEKLHDQLVIVNRNLWDAGNDVRHCESLKQFDEEFVGKARSMYFLNDRRHELKNKINSITGSKISEVKEYVDYQ